MKPTTVKAAPLLLALFAALLTIGLVSWGQKKTPGQQQQAINDTIPKKIKDVDRKVRDLDDVLDQLDDVDLKMDLDKIKQEVANALKDVDGEKIRKEVEQALKEVNLEKIKLQVADAMKEVDIAKIQKEIAESMSKVDMEKMKKDLQLTDDQSAKIQALGAATRSKVKSIREDQFLSADQKKEQVAAAFKKQHEDMNSLLTPGQVQKMEAMRAKHMHRDAR